TPTAGQYLLLQAELSEQGLAFAYQPESMCGPDNRNNPTPFVLISRSSAVKAEQKRMRKMEGKPVTAGHFGGIPDGDRGIGRLPPFVITPVFGDNTTSHPTLSEMATAARSSR